jgi:3-deoxy-D-manno-octulosonic-acid transferase
VIGGADDRGREADQSGKGPCSSGGGDCAESLRFVRIGWIEVRVHAGLIIIFADAGSTSKEFPTVFRAGMESVVMGLYSLLLLGVLVLGAPYWLVRMVFSSKDRGRYRAGLGERLGRVPAALRQATRRRKVVWVHAVSVGEVLAATRLVQELETALGEGWSIVVSTTTATGQALARERFGAERVFFYPLDIAWAVRAYLRALEPKLLVLMESELWPRMLVECRSAGVPTAVANARVSDRSYARAMKVRAVWGKALRMVGLYLAQSEEDARRLVALGARPDVVRTIGNLKYDVRAAKASQVAELIRTAAAGRPIVVAGSTVDDKPASEEQIFLQAGMGPVWQSYPDTLLVLAPRHPQRFDEISELATHFGLTIRATKLLQRGAGTAVTERIVVLDTIGDLAAVYGIADVAFVGGSLVRRGGHNPLEPAQFGVPVVMGPSFENFRDIVTKMQEADGIRIVRDKDELETALIELLTDREQAKAMGERGRRVFEQQQGATARAVEALVRLVRR